MLCALGYQLHGLIGKYSRYDVSVKMSVHHREQQLVFPSVTICNMNPIKKSAYNNNNNNNSINNNNNKAMKRRKRDVNNTAKETIVSRKKRELNDTTGRPPTLNV